MVENFGWPCFEGTLRQAGYDAADLSLCESLFTAAGAKAPFYRYGHTAKVFSDESCPTGSSSISGLAFTPPGSSPAGDELVARALELPLELPLPRPTELPWRRRRHLRSARPRVSGLTSSCASPRRTQAGWPTPTRIRLDPKTVALSFRSNPGGLNLTVSGSTAKTPSRAR